MIRIAVPCFLSVLCAAGAGRSAMAKTVSTYALVSAGSRIGTLVATEEDRRVSIDWRVDENGRGAKITERLELTPAGIPVRWVMEGKGWVGAPVKEEFEVAGDTATWRSLDDSGEAKVPPAGSAPLYIANNASPWALGLYVRATLAAPGSRIGALPGGELRVEKVRELALGEGPGAPVVTAYALWGVDLVPLLVLLHADGRFAGSLWPGWVLIEESSASRFEMLSKAAADCNAGLLRALSARITHRYEAPVWITNVRVFDPATGKLSRPTNVIVFRDVISGVRDGNPPPDAVVVDGSGGTLLPGLHDLHAHAWDWAGPLHLAGGVTSTRDPGNDNSVLLDLVRRIESGELPGPRIEMSGTVEGESPFSVHMGFVVGSVEAGLEKVRWYADHGYRGLKIYNSVRPEWVGPLAAEAHRLGLRVHGHVPAFMTSDQALLDGFDEIAHVNQLVLSWIIGPKDDTRTPFRFTALGERLGRLELSDERVRRTVAILRERRAALDPTIAIFAAMLLAQPGKTAPCDAAWLDHVPLSVQRGRKSAVLDARPEDRPAYEASWKRLKEVLALLHREGIRLLPGTDDMPGFMLHSELETWVEAGIPAADALRLATLGAAQYQGTDQRLGTIAPGKLADLVLVDGDPLTDISAIRKARLVMKAGNVYFPDELHAALGVRPFATRPAIRGP